MFHTFFTISFHDLLIIKYFILLCLFVSTIELLTCYFLLIFSHKLLSVQLHPLRNVACNNSCLPFKAILPYAPTEFLYQSSLSSISNVSFYFSFSIGLKCSPLNVAFYILLPFIIYLAWHIPLLHMMLSYPLNKCFSPNRTLSVLFYDSYAIRCKIFHGISLMVKNLHISIFLGLVDEFLLLENVC